MLKVSSIWFFVTWYGSIRGQKSAKSLSGKGLNWLARSRLKTIGKNRSNVFLYKGFIPYNSRPLHNTNRRTFFLKSNWWRCLVKFSQHTVVGGAGLKSGSNLYWVGLSDTPFSFFVRNAGFTFPKLFWRKTFTVETTIENIFNNWFFLRKKITILHLDKNQSLSL